MFCGKKTSQSIDTIMNLRPIPYQAQRLPGSDDRRIYTAEDYYNEEIISRVGKNDIKVTAERSKEDDIEELCTSFPIHVIATSSQVRQDRGILYEWHLKKGIPMLHILDVKPLQYGLEDHVLYSWKFDEVSKECKLEIVQSDRNETRKRTVNFSFATNVTDNLLSKVVDGFEVKYMLRTDAIRLSLELQVVLPPPHIMPDFSKVHGEIKLETKHDGKPLFIVDLHSDQPPNKKPKIDHYNNAMIVSFIRVIPRNLPPLLKLTVSLKDSTSMLEVHTSQKVFPYNIPCDQRDYILFKNGHIRFDICWGCSLSKGKGICEGVCTCEHCEFSGFSSLVEACCSRTNVE